MVDAVNAWAQDGYLTASYRPGRRLPVVVSAWASVTDPRNYNEEFTVTFDAPSPYWEDTAAQVCSVTSGTSFSGTVRNIGTAPAPVCFTLTPASATLNTLSVTVDGHTFSFTGLGVASGTALKCSYDSRGYLRIMAGNTSKLSCRTAASDDMLTARPGVNGVSVTSNTAVSGTVEVTARWL